MDERLAKIDEERQALALKLEQRLKRGDFDLGRIGDDQQRENLARQYVEDCEDPARSSLTTEVAGDGEGACSHVAGQALKPDTTAR